MKRLLCAFVFATSLTGCITVNGRSLASFLPGSKSNTPASSAAEPAAQPGKKQAVLEVPATVLALELESPTNPIASTVKASPAVETTVVFRERCKWSGAYELQPLARLEVKARSTWEVSAPSSKLMVQTPDGACVEPKGDWTLGTYTVFAEVHQKPVTEVTLLVRNLERRLVVPEAARLTPTPALPFAFELTAAADTGSSEALCGASATEPAALVEVRSALVGQFRVLHPHHLKFKAVLVSDAAARVACKEVPRDEVAAGTWALFLAGPPGAKAWVTLEPLTKNASSSKDAWKWALRQLKPVPAVVPLAERELSAWYPWFTSRAVEPLFLDAPKSLFVTTTVDAEVPQGEPLLLVTWGAEQSTVLRATGERVQVRTERLGDVGGEVKLPATFPEVKAKEEKDYSWEAVAPHTMAPRFEDWRMLRGKNYDCVDAYMSKRDPSWGKQNYIVIVGRREAALAVADKQCNTAAVDAGWAKLKVDAVAERKSLRAKLVASLPAKLK